MSDPDTIKDLSMIYGQICAIEVRLRHFGSHNVKINEGIGHTIASLEEAGRTLRAAILLGITPVKKPEE